jgi:hypothetical protein
MFLNIILGIIKKDDWLYQQKCRGSKFKHALKQSTEQNVNT